MELHPNLQASAPQLELLFSVRGQVILEMWPEDEKELNAWVPPSAAMTHRMCQGEVLESGRIIH